MLFSKQRSLKSRLTLLMTLASSIALLVSAVAFFGDDVVMMRRSKVHQLTALADLLASNSAVALSFNMPQPATNLLASLANRPTIESACLFDASGRVFAVYQQDHQPDFSPDRPDWVGHRFRPGGYLDVALPVFEEGRTIGTIYVRASMRDLRGQLYRYALIAAGVLLLSFGVAVLLASRLQRVISLPIVNLAAAAERITDAGDYSIRLRPQSADEIGNLYVQFNLMLQRIQAREEELRRLTTIIETTSDLVGLATPDCQITYLNRAGRRLLGMGENEELAGLTTSDIHPEWALRTVQSEGNPGAVADGTWEGETAILGPNGQEVPVSQVIMFHKSEGGEYLSTIMRDITERKRTEEEALHLRRLLKNISDSMPSVLVAVDDQGRVTHWNREAARTTGVSSQKAEGCSLTRVFPELSREMAKVSQAIRQNTAQMEQKVARKEKGQTRFEDITVYPLAANGVEGAVIRIDDVTERVRIEEMMIQSEKMMSIGGLAAGMAHEINNPLAGILQNVQVVMDRLSAEMPANREAAQACGASMESIHAYLAYRGIDKMLEAVKVSGRRAADIVQNMLSFSRKSDARIGYHDPRQLLDQTIELAASDYDLKKKYDFRQIEIVRDYASNVPKVPCEGTKIQQVILNLLRNGAQAMTEKGDRIEPPRFILRILREEEVVRIEVEDNGPGMDEATRRRIFEPFFTTKDVGGGIGLGLSVSYFIIADDHGGSMVVESAPGQGAKFVIRLPLEREM